MKYDPNETYEQWIERARTFELSLAKKRIEKGDDPEKVIEEMGRRLMEKMLHPVIKAIMPTPPSIEEIKESRKKYEESMKKIGPKADHVLDENIDSPE